MGALESQVADANRPVRGRGPDIHAAPDFWRIDDDWAQPLGEEGAATMASYLQEPEDPDDLVECVACQFSVREVYLLTDSDSVPRLYPGDA
eukprot:13609435-Alexandrium_andersonii.AAC.1